MSRTTYSLPDNYVRKKIDPSKVGSPFRKRILLSAESVAADPEGGTLVRKCLVPSPDQSSDCKYSLRFGALYPSVGNNCEADLSPSPLAFMSISQRAENNLGAQQVPNQKEPVEVIVLQEDKKQGVKKRKAATGRPGEPQRSPMLSPCALASCQLWIMDKLTSLRKVQPTWCLVWWACETFKLYSSWLQALLLLDSLVLCSVGQMLSRIFTILLVWRLRKRKREPE